MATPRLLVNWWVNVALAGRVEASPRVRVGQAEGWPRHASREQLVALSRSERMAAKDGRFDTSAVAGEAGGSSVAW